MKISIDKEEYIGLIKRFDAKIITFKAWSKREGQIKGRRLAVRHDVDITFEGALDMARYENKHGIKSTYFLLHSHPYFGKNKKFLEGCRELVDLGHDIGFHNNALVTSFQTGRSVDNIVEESLSILRDYCRVEVLGSSAHGAPETYTNGLYNYCIWSEFDPLKNEGVLKKKTYPLSKFGLEYETYFLPSVGYMTDSAKVWCSLIYDKKTIKNYERPLRQNQNLRNKLAIKKFNTMRKGVFQLLVHPIRSEKWTQWLNKRRIEKMKKKRKQANE